ncbi:unnamed protein product [Camellia sinensis]
MENEAITAAELAEEDRSDVEDEISSDVANLSSYVQLLDYKMSELMREERSEEEMQELKAAIEAFNGDQDELKKQLSEIQIKFGDKRGIEQEMHGLISENKIEDSSDGVDLHCETSMKTEGPVRKLRRLLSNFGESGDDLKNNIENYLIMKMLKEMKRESDRSVDSDGTEDEIARIVEGITQKVFELISNTGNKLKKKLDEIQKESDRSDDDSAEREVYAIVEGLIEQSCDLTQQLCDYGNDLKKKLEAMRNELNQPVYCTEHEVYRPTVEELTKKLCDIGTDLKEELKQSQKESDLYDDQAESETFRNAEKLERTISKTEGYKNKKTDDEHRRLSKESVMAEIGGFKSESAEFEKKSDNSIDLEVYTNIEGLEDEMYALMRHQADKSTEKSVKEQYDLSKQMLKRLMKNTTDSDEESETEISSLQANLVVLMLEKEKAQAKFQQLKSETELLKQSNCEKEMEIVDLVKSKVAAILEPTTDDEVRDRIDSLFQSQIDQLMKQTKAKMVQAESEEMELVTDQMHNELADSTITSDKALDAEKGLKLKCSAIAVVITGAVAALAAFFCLGNAKVQRRSKD